jgi:hypothetical protein
VDRNDKEGNEQDAEEPACDGEGGKRHLDLVFVEWTVAVSTGARAWFLRYLRCAAAIALHRIKRLR